MIQIRAFVAIELPEPLRLKLARLVLQLRQASPSGVKWVNPDSIHLTLKFLGSIPAETVPRITHAIHESAKDTGSITLRAEGLGVFPNPRRPQVVWVGVSGETARLAGLQKRIEAGLAPLGFAPESRPFTAHLTLARTRDEMTPEARERLGKLITTSRFEATTFTADGLSLMRSELRRDGAVYTRLSFSRFESQTGCGDGP